MEKSMDRIIPHLYLGNMEGSYDIDLLTKNRISVIINMALEIPENKKVNQYLGIKYYTYLWDDTPNFNILKEMDNVTSFIHSLISKGNNVLVHCRAGVSRSASVVIAYLIRYYGMTPRDAYSYVKNRRPIINPNPGFIRQLNHYFSLYKNVHATGGQSPADNKLQKSMNDLNTWYNARYYS